MQVNKILLLEDHKEAQKWLATSAQSAFGSSVEIIITETVADAMSCLLLQTFDLGIIDMHLPDGSGVEIIRYAKQKNASMPCVVATIYSDDQHIFPALQAGAEGYFLKDHTQNEIANMLRQILEGKPPLSPEVAQKMLGFFHEREKEEHSLTDREVETLNLIVKGMGVREVAEYMSLSPHTVAGYMKEVYRKLHVSSRAEATLEAVRLGIIQTSD